MSKNKAVFQRFSPTRFDRTEKRKSKLGNFLRLKGIVSRDWGGLQMILLDRLEVFNISATHLFLILSAFSYSKFKNGRLSGASFQHSSSKDQYSSGDSNSLA